MQSHAPLDAAVDGAALVLRKIVTGLTSQKEAYLFDRTLGLGGQNEIGRSYAWSTRKIGRDLASQFFHGRHHIGQPSIDGAPGHGVELGRGGGLHEHRASLLLDGGETQGTIRAHSREDDANALGSLVGGQGSQERIYGQTKPTWRRWRQQVQHSVQNGQILVGWNDVDPIRLDLQAILDLKNLHRRGPRKQLDQHALVRRVQVLNDHESHSALLGQVAQETLERFQTSSRGTNAGNRE